MNAADAVPARPMPTESANDRLKRLSDSWFWGSMIVATAVHFGAFVLAPEMTTEDFSFTSEELEAIDIPPEIDIPPPPHQISRPATPVIATADIDEDITIAPTTFEDNPIDDLPPPPDAVPTDIAEALPFSPFTVAPRVLNKPEIQRALMREYPPTLRDSGIGGTVQVSFYVDTEGRVRQTRILQGSPYAALDEAALSVADVYRFEPALNRDTVVPVWVTFAIRFEVTR